MAEARMVQLEEMTRRARVAMQRHVGAVIAFHYPPDVAVIAAWHDAVTAGLIEYNEAGEAVLRAMAADWPAERQPTVIMVREAWDAAREQA